MRKLRLFIFISMVIFLIMVLSIVSRADQVKRENAKTKIEQAINKVPIVQNTIDSSEVKQTIRNDVGNSKIINNDNDFPVYTVVDGYGFKVEENGDVKDVDNIELNQNSQNEPKENINEEIRNEQENINNTNENRNDNTNEDNKKETIVKYKDETKTDKGITISTTKDGMVTINGKSTEKLFIKISNGIAITDKIERDFETWKNEDRSYN